jgi:signal transduction histidine kinase
MTRIENISDFFAKQARGWIFLEALALVAGIGFIDYLTGYEVEVFPFYSLPILLTVRFSDKRAAVVISLFSALAWFLADRASGHKYSQEWLRLWDAVVRMMFFCLVMFAGATLRSQRDAHRARIELLERSHQLEEEIINVSEREQERIGRDFHDGVCQYLAAISFTAGVLKQDLEHEAHARSKTAGEIADLLQDAIVCARDLARGLSPVDRDEGGLESALNELSVTTSRLVGITCTFICAGPIDIRNNTRAIHLFRIAQEALSNAVKHANARKVVISVEGTPESVSLRVSDDGIGFDPKSSVRSGMGLNIMRYRARTLGGTLDIYPNSPSGTIVACCVSAAA